jgi:hypothetical protein
MMNLKKVRKAIVRRLFYPKMGDNLQENSSPRQRFWAATKQLYLTTHPDFSITQQNRSGDKQTSLT